MQKVDYEKISVFLNIAFRLYTYTQYSLKAFSYELNFAVSFIEPFPKTIFKENTLPGVSIKFETFYRIASESGRTPAVHSSLPVG